MTEIYLDNNATTQPLEEVRAAMFEALGPDFGNPSSVHGAGARARRCIARARDAVAQLIGAREDQITFTSGGTEANNLVLQRARAPSLGCRLITSTVEHSSVLKMAEHLSEEGIEIALLPVDGVGLIDVAELEHLLSDGPALVSVQWVNNETGVIQDIDAIGEICRAAGAVFHTDAAQAVGKMDVRVHELPVDFLTLTAHKLHGPSGVGAVYATDGHRVPLMAHGGPQERGLRAGTENYAGIVGFGVAAEKRLASLGAVQTQLSMLRDRIEERLLTELSGTRVNGTAVQRICNTTNVRLPIDDGQALVARLDRRGVRCSQSSACTNQRPEPSYVLRAMGLSEDAAYSSMRLSVSELNTGEEMDTAADVILSECKEIQRIFGSSQPQAATVQA